MVIEEDCQAKDIIKKNREALNLACKNNLSKKGRFLRHFYDSLIFLYKLKKGAVTRLCKRFKRIGDVVEEKYIEDLNGFGKLREKDKRGNKGLFDEAGVLQHHYNIIGQQFVDRLVLPSARDIHFGLTCTYDFVMSIQTTRSHLKKRLKSHPRTLQYVLQCKEDKECMFDKIDKSYVPLPQPLYPYRPDVNDLGTSGRVQVLLWEGINPPVAPAAPSYKAHLHCIKEEEWHYNSPRSLGFVNALGPADTYVYYAHLVPLPDVTIVVAPNIDDDFLCDLYDDSGGKMDAALVASLASSKPLVRKRKASVFEGMENRRRRRGGGVCVVDSDDECGSNPDNLLGDEEETEGDDVNMDDNDGASIHEEGDVVDEHGNVIDEYDAEYIDDTEYDAQPYHIAPFMY
jgi:hypothetical protein